MRWVHCPYHHICLFRLYSVILTSDVSRHKHVAGICSFVLLLASPDQTCPSQRLHRSTPSWRHAWTTITPFMLERPRVPQTSSIEYWMLQLAWSVTVGSMTIDSAALAERSSAGAIQAVCNGLPMSTAKGTTPHGWLLLSDIRHCWSAASAIRLLPSAARTAPPVFDVRPSCLLGRWQARCHRELMPDYRRDPTRSFDSFRCDLKMFLFFV